MKYRLNSDHFLDEQVVPAMTEIGDGCGIAFRDAAGKPRPPSREMTPLDAEAKSIFEKRFSHGAPPSDPTKPIPLQGSGAVGGAKVPAAMSPKPGAPVPTPIHPVSHATGPGSPSSVGQGSATPPHLQHSTATGPDALPKDS